MKKAIRAVIVILVACICALSCKKIINTVAITGEWELIRTTVYVDGVMTEDIPSTQVRTFYNFESDGVFTITKTLAVAGAAADIQSGRWRVDGNQLIMIFLDDTKIYDIDKANLFRLELSETTMVAGKKMVTKLTLTNDIVG